MAKKIIEHQEYAIKYKNKCQEEFAKLIHKKHFVIAIGPPGTGRTFISVVCALNLILKDNRFNKIIITRPAVQCQENLGFLPGELNEKFDPYIAPIKDVLDQVTPSEKHVESIMKNMIECIPIAFIRGRTFKKSIVILDEAQNCTLDQLDAVIGRISYGSKLIINGDINQSDIHHSGLYKKYKTFMNNEDEFIGCIEFTKEHIVRNRLIEKLIDISKPNKKKETLIDVLKSMNNSLKRKNADYERH